VGAELKLTAEEQAILDGLPDDAKPVLASLLSKAVDVGKASAEADEGDDDGSGDDGGSGDQGESDDEVIAKADPQLRRIIEKAQADATKAAKDAKDAAEIAKSERDKRVHNEMVEIAKSLPNIQGTDDDKAELLKAAYAVSQEHGDKILASFRAANNQLADTEFGREIGKSGGGSNTVQTEVENKAKELQKADPKLSIEKARTTVLERDPDLYSRMMKEG
jgi:hypothetical protein